MIIAGYIGIVVIAAVLIVTNPNNYRTKAERKESKNDKEV